LHTQYNINSLHKTPLGNSQRGFRLSPHCVRFWGKSDDAPRPIAPSVAPQSGATRTSATRLPTVAVCLMTGTHWQLRIGGHRSI
jgi:hypothetical protein